MCVRGRDGLRSGRLRREGASAATGEPCTAGPGRARRDIFRGTVFETRRRSKRGCLPYKDVLGGRRNDQRRQRRVLFTRCYGRNRLRHAVEGIGSRHQRPGKDGIIR